MILWWVLGGGLLWWTLRRRPEPPRWGREPGASPMLGGALGFRAPLLPGPPGRGELDRPGAGALVLHGPEGLFLSWGGPEPGGPGLAAPGMLAGRGGPAAPAAPAVSFTAPGFALRVAPSQLFADVPTEGARARGVAAQAQTVGQVAGIAGIGAKLAGPPGALAAAVLAVVGAVAAGVRGVAALIARSQESEATLRALPLARGTAPAPGDEPEADVLGVVSEPEGLAGLFGLPEGPPALGHPGEAGPDVGPDPGPGPDVGLGPPGEAGPDVGGDGPPGPNGDAY